MSRSPEQSSAWERVDGCDGCLQSCLTWPGPAQRSKLQPSAAAVPMSASMEGELGFKVSHTAQGGKLEGSACGNKEGLRTTNVQSPKKQRLGYEGGNTALSVLCTHTHTNTHHYFSSCTVSQTNSSFICQFPPHLGMSGSNVYSHLLLICEQYRASHH